MKWLKNIGYCFYKATVNTINHDGVEHAGYLAFLGLLSLFPFLVVVFALAGFVGAGETGAVFITHTLATLPKNFTQALEPRIIEIISGPPQGLLTVSIVGAIWTASSAVEGLRTILNRAYHVGTPPAYWFRRLLSILQLLFFTFIMVSGILLLVIIPLLLHFVEQWLGVAFLSTSEAWLGHVAWIGTLAILFFAICYIYYIIPNIKQRFVSVAPGAAVVVVCWFAAAYLFTQYLAHFDQVNLIYGSLGGFIAAMIFLYICNVIFIFGAELNHQVVEMLGLHMAQREQTSGSVPD